MNHSNLATCTKSGWLAVLDMANDRQRLRDAMQSHYGTLDVRQLNSMAIVGAASEGQRLARICQTQKIAIEAIVDDNPVRRGLMVSGSMVEAVDVLARLPKSTPVVIASHRVLRVIERIRNLGFDTVVPFATLQVLAPQIFPSHMFYDGLLEDLFTHRSEYHVLNERLADDRSRQVLDAVIGFRQTLDPAVLQPVVSENDLYAPEGLFEFNQHEAYVDGGSY
ncbi:MAG: hypothetical protein WCA56_02000, partial [Xanthobacteraceae bacterium]